MARRSHSWARSLTGWLQRPIAGISLLTFFALLIHGYHPYADDGAIYVAAVEKVVKPGLFPLHNSFVLPPIQHSLFSFVLGWTMRAFHIPLAYALFLTYLASLWLILFACYRIAQALFSRAHARWAAVVLLAVTLTMPVAGTAIFFSDPYLTARSFSTPASLFAIAYAMESRMLRSALCLLAACLLHPLMAIYAIVYVVVLALIRVRRMDWLAGLAVAPLALGFAGSHAAALIGDTHAYRVAAMSRTYFFLDQWRWFEWLGLFPPLIAAAVYWSRRRFSLQSDLDRISATSLALGTALLLFAVVFTRSAANPFLACLQPLRVFQLIYILFFLAIGGLLGEYVLQRQLWRWLTCFATIAIAMCFFQLRAYPSLQHVEWPWSRPSDPWEQAFLWIRNNTPESAYFALDPYYQTLAGEDTIGFRAMTERSVLPDWNKDGGIAAIDPSLADQWWGEVHKTESFANWGDQQRIRVLKSLGANWIVLPGSASTQFACPYRNSTVRVCQLPEAKPSVGE